MSLNKPSAHQFSANKCVGVFAKHLCRLSGEDWVARLFPDGC